MAAAVSFTVERLDHPAVVVTDVERARKFYTSVLRLQEIPRPASFDFPGAWFRLGPDPWGQTLHLLGQPQAEATGRRHFCLWVSDVHAAARWVAAAGCAVAWNTRHKIPGVERFFTDDPDGNRIEIQGPEAT